MAKGDLVWEVLRKNYFQQFNERTGRNGRVKREDIQQLEMLCLVRLVRQSPHRLDFYDITEQGRTFIDQ